MAEEEVDEASAFDEVPSELSTSIVPPVLQDSDLTKWQLSFHDIISHLQHNFRGEYWSEEDKKWINTENPIMNEKGIGALTLIISSYINKNVFLSNLDNEIILEIVRDVNFDIKNKLLVSYKEFGMKKEDLSTVTNIIVSAIYLSLRRAFEEGEKRFLKLTSSREIVRTIQQPSTEEQKKGFWIFRR